ncbi:MAG: helix-turn-helix transcriptional regulator [Dehalococcoidia bacterium]
MDGRHPVPALSPRQREVLQLLDRGHTNGEIADRLGISLQGAKWHVSELMSKFGVDSREELAEIWRSRHNRFFRILGAVMPSKVIGLKIASATTGIVAVAGLGAGVAAYRHTLVPDSQERASYQTLDSADPAPEVLHFKSQVAKDIVDPVGVEVRVAWLDNEPDTEELKMFPARAGNWCFVYPSGETACGMTPERVGVMDIGLSTAHRADEHTWHGYLTAITSSEVETVEIVGKDGTSATFATQLAPAGAPQCLRYLYVQFDPFGNDITVIGRDQAGREVAREHRELGVAPPPPVPRGPNPGCV